MDSNTQFLLEIAKLVGTLIAAGVAAWVAYSIGSSQRDIAHRQAETAAEQKRIAAAKLNLELFEERYALFEKVWGFLSSHVIGDDNDMHILPADFNNLIPKAQFLFGKAIAEYMREASSRHVRLANIKQAIRQRASSAATQEEAADLLDHEGWFYREASTGYKRFADFLDFSAWKVDAWEILHNPNAVF